MPAEAGKVQSEQQAQKNAENQAEEDKQTPPLAANKESDPLEEEALEVELKEAADADKTKATAFIDESSRRNRKRNNNKAANRQLFLEVGSEVTKEDSKCPGGCSQHGDCNAKSGRCMCFPGYIGADCSEELQCQRDCSGKGTCARGKCFCNPGFSGLDCSVALTCPGNCTGHGVCKYGQCFCEPQFKGTDCSEPLSATEANKGCPQGCNGNGMCVMGQCYCSGDFTGKACEQVFAPNRVAEKVEAVAAPRQAAAAKPTHQAKIGVYDAMLISGAAFVIGAVLSMVLKKKRPQFLSRFGLGGERMSDADRRSQSHASLIEEQLLESVR
jgi:hypothetical protein